MEKSIYRLNLIMLTLLVITLNFTELSSYLLTDSVLNGPIGNGDILFIVAIFLLKIVVCIEVEKRNYDKEWHKTYRKILIMINLIEIMIWNPICVIKHTRNLILLDKLVYLLPIISSIIVMTYKRKNRKEKQKRKVYNYRF